MLPEIYGISFPPRNEKKKQSKLPLQDESLYVFPNCKSLWIKVSAKWLNVNVNVNASVSLYHNSAFFFFFCNSQFIYDNSDEKSQICVFYFYSVEGKKTEWWEVHLETVRKSRILSLLWEKKAQFLLYISQFCLFFLRFASFYLCLIILTFFVQMYKLWAKVAITFLSFFLSFFLYLFFHGGKWASIDIKFKLNLF